jgi:hypothetical protein
MSILYHYYYFRTYEYFATAIPGCFPNLNLLNGLCVPADERPNFFIIILVMIYFGMVRVLRQLKTPASVPPLLYQPA